jgi:hypothetical protein
MGFYYEVARVTYKMSLTMHPMHWKHIYVKEPYIIEQEKGKTLWKTRLTGYKTGC